MIAKTKEPSKPLKPAVPTGELLTTEQVAEKIKVSVRYLVQLRIKKKSGGPKFLKFGHLVRYDANEIERWLQEHSHQY